MDHTLCFTKNMCYISQLSILTSRFWQVNDYINIGTLSIIQILYFWPHKTRILTGVYLLLSYIV